jgi:hypothetical protein
MKIRLRLRHRRARQTRTSWLPMPSTISLDQVFHIAKHPTDLVSHNINEAIREAHVLFPVISILWKEGRHVGIEFAILKSAIVGCAR